jgi:hypothetical protein
MITSRPVTADELLGELRRARVSSGTHGQAGRPGKTGFADGGEVKAPTTAPLPSAASQRPPKWSQITGATKYQALDAAGRESVRLSYWRDVVSPMVHTDELEEALTRFEQRTGGPLQAVRNPPPTDEEIDRASKPARMTVTKEGQPILGPNRSVENIREAQRRMPSLRQFTDVQGWRLLNNAARKADAPDEAQDDEEDAFADGGPVEKPQLRPLTAEDAPALLEELRRARVSSADPGAKSTGVRTPSPADFPVETPEEAQRANENQLAILNKEAAADPELQTDPAHQRERARAAERSGGKAAPLISISGEDGEAPAQPAPAKRTPKWSQIEASPKYQALDVAGKTSVQESYWREVVAPLVPTDELDMALAEFNKRTKKPSLMQRATKAVKSAITPTSTAPGEERTGAEPPGSDLPLLESAATAAEPPGPAPATAAGGESGLSGETLDQLERSYRSLKQGVFAVDMNAARRALNVLDRVDKGERLMPADDPFNFRTMTPERRAEERKRLEAGYGDALKTIATEAAKISELYQNPNAAESINAANEGRWKDAWAAFVADPVGIVKDLSLSNAAQIVPMAALGTVGAAVKGVPGLMLGFAGGSFPVDYAMSLVEYLGDQGIDLKDYKAIDAKLREPDFLNKLQNYAVLHATGVAAGDAVASGFMRPLVGGAKAISKAAAGNVAKGIAGESGGEAAGEILATGKIQPGDVIAEGLAAGPMTAAGSVASTVSAAKADAAAKPTTPPGVDLSDPAGISRAVAGETDEAAPAAITDERHPPADALDEAATERSQTFDSPVDEQSHAAATSPLNDKREPTKAEILAGNAPLGHPRVAGMEISVENPAGSIREDKHNDPPQWRTEIKGAHYGYLPGSVAYDSTEKRWQGLDAFVKEGTPPDWQGTVFVVNQTKGGGAFDEHKSLIGWNTEQEAREAYLRNYDDRTAAERRIRSIVPIELEQFKAWAYDKSENGPRGGELKPTTLLGQPIDKLTRAELELTAKEARTLATREAAKAELERRARASGETQSAMPDETAQDLQQRVTAEDFSERLRTGSKFTTEEARAFARERLQQSGERTASVAEQVDRSLEHGAAIAAESLAARMGERGRTPQEIDLALADLYGRLPKAIATRVRELRTEGEAGSGGPAERAAVGIVLTPPYTGTAGEVAIDADRARPDAIRQAIRDLFNVPINEGGFKGSRDQVGLYKIKPRTIRVRNQNDISVIAHETGHHFSETSRPVRELMKAHEKELRTITSYAASQKSAALQREEGFAEYLRLRWGEPAQAKAKAPGFSSAFEQYVDKNGYRPAFDAIEGAIRDWQNLPPAERILAKVGEAAPDFRKRVNLDRFVFQVFDRWLPLKRMVEALKPDVAASADPFKLAHLLSGDAAIIEDWLLRETVPFDFTRRANTKDRGKPLSEILSQVRDQQREFGAYLIAKRANELMTSGKEHLYSADEIAAGLRLETPEFKKAAEDLYRYQDQLLDYAVEGGLLSEHVAEQFRKFPFYVPFFRVGEPTGSGGDIFKRILGGTENLRDPIANVIENTARVIHATNRNFVLAKAHNLAREVNGGGRWIEDVPIPERAIRIETEKIIEALRAQGVEIDQETAESLATTMQFFVKNPLGDERQRIIMIHHNGRKRSVQINDELLWQALERFEPVDMGLAEKILSVPADLLRAGVVLSPEFMARNFARDTLSGFIQSKSGILPVVGTLGGFKEIATRSDAARLYRAFGGAYGDLWKGDTGFERVLVERMARRGGFDPRTIVTPRGLISLLHRIGSVSEAGTRVAEFKKTMKPGDIDSLIDAAYNAREVSVDFGMHGHSRTVRFLTRITPFLNPAMQGFYKMGRTGFDQPLATLLRGAMLTAFSMALFLINRDEDWYDEIEQWEKNTYWHADIGLKDDAGKVIPLRVPKPFEWGALFGSIPEALTDVSITQHGKDFAKRMLSIADNVFGFRTIPTALLVPIELWGNRDTFTDRPIVPGSKEKVDPEFQANPGTSKTARVVGKVTETAPAKIDHAVRGFFGTLGVFTMMLADQVLKAAGDYPEAPAVPWQRAPLARVFFHDPSGSNDRYSTEFYAILKDAQQAEGTLRLLNREQMKPYIEEHGKELRAFPMATGAAQLTSVLRRENERIAASDNYSAEEKARLIEKNNERIRTVTRLVVRKYG